MSDVEIYHRLTQIFRDVLHDDAIVLSPEILLNDIPTWDSLRLVLAGLDAEEHFSIALPTHELEQLASVGDFVGLIRAKLSAA